MALKTSLTKNQKQALFALAHDSGGYLHSARWSGADTAWATSHRSERVLAPWTVTFRTLRSIRAAGLLATADCGGGSERLTLNRHGRNAVYRLVSREDKALSPGSDQESARVRRWVDGMMIPPGRLPTIAAILRCAAEDRDKAKIAG